jgi:hypothetical protein
MNKLFLIPISFFLLIFVLAQTIQSPRLDSPDREFSEKKTIILNITQTDGFEKFINLTISKDSETKFRIDYELNSSFFDNITQCLDSIPTKKGQCFEKVKDDYLKEVSLADLTNSINNLDNYPIAVLSGKVRVDKSSLKLPKGTFYVDLIDYDSNNVAKSAGQKIKLGFNSIYIETVETTNDVGGYSSIAIDSTGIVHIAHTDYTSYDLRYCNNTAGTWTCIAVDTTNTVGPYTSLAIDSTNKIHISHYDDTNGALRYCNNTAGTWTCSEVDTTATSGTYTSLAIDSTNKIHISHLIGVSNNNLKYCNNTAGTWTCAVITGSGSTYYYSSLAIDSTNKIHIASRKNTNDYIEYYNNTAGTWTSYAVYTAGTLIADTVSIAIDSTGVVHLSTSNRSIASPKNDDLRYCNNTAGTWTCTTIETAGDVGRSSAIAVDANNKFHITHFDGTNNDLRYCNNTAGTWTCTKLMDSSAGTLPNSPRAIAIKKGRIVDTTSFSNFVHFSNYNNTDLFYLNISNPAPLVPPDTLYPIFSNYLDNNASLIVSGIALFNVTIENTNGTATLIINGTNYSATNLTSNMYNVSLSVITNGTFQYNWTAYGNGTSTNLNMSESLYYTINQTTPQTNASSLGSSTVFFGNSQNDSSNKNLSNTTIEHNQTICNLKAMEIPLLFNNFDLFFSTKRPILLGEIGCQQAKQLNYFFTIQEIKSNFEIIGFRMWLPVTILISLSIFIFYQLLLSNSILKITFRKVFKHKKQQDIMGKRGYIFLFLIILFGSFASASLPDSLHVNYQNKDAGGSIITGTYNFTFNLTESTDCTNPIYSNFSQYTTDSDGIISAYLGNSNQLNYSNPLYLCIYRGNSLKENFQVGIVPYAYRARNVSWAGVEGAPLVNATFNQSLTDLLYSDIKWGYNQTYSGSTFNTTYDTWLPNYTASNKFWYNMTTQFINWLSTFAYNYNQTTPANTYSDNINTTLSSRIDGISGGDNSSWNESRANTLYADIKWGYNMTQAGSGSTFNTTYATWLPNYTASNKFWYNQTYGGSTYNLTYHGLINNVSYLATFNTTYATWFPNFTAYNKFWYNMTIAGGGSCTPTTGSICTAWTSYSVCSGLSGASICTGGTYTEYTCQSPNGNNCDSWAARDICQSWTSTNACTSWTTIDLCSYWQSGNWCQ